ncbi:MAG: hypothetical protein COS49_02570, partial [Candidatus Portnoybacteria bacterium CG03_land_8_20_14_0_80_41_10]
MIKKTTKFLTIAIILFAVFSLLFSEFFIFSPSTEVSASPGGSIKTILYMSTAAHTGGNFGGRSGADTFCSNNKPAGLTATNIHALLCVSATDEVQDMPSVYGYGSSNPLYWYNTNTGATTQFASSWSDFLDGTISVSPASGTGVNSDYFTGCRQNGSISWSCSSWTSSDAWGGNCDQDTTHRGDQGATTCGYYLRALQTNPGAACKLAGIYCDSPNYCEGSICNATRRLLCVAEIEEVNWYGAGNYTFNIDYEDPTGGSGLIGCKYKIVSGTSPICTDDGWIDAPNCNPSCSGSSCTCGINVSIGGNCNTNGVGACKICSKATDGAGNTGYGERSLNIDFAAPSVSVTGAPVSWQNSDATANVSCSDAHSGCDATTYKLKTYTSNPGTCSTNYADYTLTSPQTISSHLWVCGAAKDNAGNTGFSTSVEFKVEKEIPASNITAPEDGSTQTADFNVTVSDTDTGGSGIDNGACYYYVFDSGVGQTRTSTLRTCNSTQLITVNPGGATGDCRTIGGTCTVYVYTYDNAGNTNIGSPGSQSFNIASGDTTPPTVLVEGAPASWQNTDATASVSCTDTESGCDTNTYNLKTYTTNPGTCSTTYADYALASPQTISNYQWLCGTAKDNAGNTGFSTSVEFKVEKEIPAS